MTYDVWAALAFIIPSAILLLEPFWVINRFVEDEKSQSYLWTFAVTSIMLFGIFFVDILQITQQPITSDSNRYLYPLIVFIFPLGYWLSIMIQNEIIVPFLVKVSQKEKK